MEKTTPPEGNIATGTPFGEETEYTMPTAEAAAESAREAAEFHARISATEYIGKRVTEYPPIGDQLDALFKAGVFPPEMADKIRAVKEKYPKPEGSQ